MQQSHDLPKASEFMEDRISFTAFTKVLTVEDTFHQIGIGDDNVVVSHQVHAENSIKARTEIMSQVLHTLTHVTNRSYFEAHTKVGKLFGYFGDFPEFLAFFLCQILIIDFFVCIFHHQCAEFFVFRIITKPVQVDELGILHFREVGKIPTKLRFLGKECTQYNGSNEPTPN